MTPYEPRIGDLLLEYMNIGMGKAAQVLNDILSAHIDLKVPELKLIDPTELINELHLELTEEIALVRMGYQGSLEGRIELIFTSESASKLVNSLTTEGFEDLDLYAIRSGTLCEVGNIVINALMGTLSNLLFEHLTYTVPEYREGKVLEILVNEAPKSELGDAILLARTNFDILSLHISGNIAVYFSIKTLEIFTKSLHKLMEN